MEEIEQHGGYPTSDNFNGLHHFKSSGRIPIPQNEVNPYVEAFWKWWPELYHDLYTFRITGGEPMMHKDTMKVLDYIIDSPNPNKELSLSINSNLGVPDSLYKKFKEKFKIISEKGLVRELIIYTSCDGHGEQAEYGRNGLVYNQLMDRIDDLCEYIPRLTINIMSTYNVLSVPSYKKLITDVYSLKAKHTNALRYYRQPLLLDNSYLRYPNHQSIKILDKEWSKEIYEQAQLFEFYEMLRADVNCYGFSDVEIVKVRRIYDYFISIDDEDRMAHRKDFYKFFSEHDKRRGTDFCKTFPELEEFFHKCK
jgi:MoaA/NifB/PqqE/SkfB family radical SAM enzyme